MVDLILVEDDPAALGICMFCGKAICVGPYYTYQEQDGLEEYVCIHKVCGDLPFEIEHDGQTYVRWDSDFSLDSQICCVCNGCSNFLHFNSLYDDDLAICITCALQLFPITHRCHEKHPLIPIHDNDGEDSSQCVACRGDRTGISFKCTACPFHVHQKCVSSQIIQLPFHGHGLKAIYHLPQDRYGKRINYCRICREDLEDFAYQCDTCKSFFHMYNCRPKKHISFKDPFVLVEEDVINIGDSHSASSYSCNGCGLGISAPYYSGTKEDCKTFLHKFCADLPTSNVKHHLHPRHALTLSYENINRCNACREPWEGFIYSCSDDDCQFAIDIICAVKTLRFKHKFHQHPLISSNVKAPYACRGCNMSSEGTSFQCTTCRFWVHQRCASLPLSKKYDFHPHVLQLSYSLEDSLPEYCNEFHCRVCGDVIQPHNWAYHCAGCKYFTHIHDCSNPNSETDESQSEAAFAAAVRLPFASKSVSLATLFFMNSSKEEDKESDSDSEDAINGIQTTQMLLLNRDDCWIDFESNWQRWKISFHQMRRWLLVSKSAKRSSSLWEFRYNNDTCRKCINLLAAPCNSCSLCKYFLPKPPSEFEDPNTLIYGYYKFLKDTEDNCNGFGMSFFRKYTNVKVSSSVLPRYVKHVAHSHVLTTTYITRPTWCHGCEKYFVGYAFKCNSCSFIIDTYCGLLPATVRHRYDKKHPFKLTYYSIEGVEEYVCEICEEDITTMWFYHCAKCDQSIHAECIWKIHIKFGPFIKDRIEFDYGKMNLVPAKDLPDSCALCNEEEVPGCRYALFDQNEHIWMHLECTSVPNLERWSTERKELSVKLAELSGLTECI